MEFVATVGCNFFSCYRNFSENNAKFMYFLSNLRTYCVIQDRICVEMLEKNSKVWKTTASHWFNPISNHLYTFVAK